MAIWDIKDQPPRGWLKPAYKYIKNKLGDNLIGAVIGVSFGYGEEYALDNLSLKKFYMIDPYVHFDFSAMTPELWEKQYEHARDKFASFPNVELWRLSSEEASLKIEDNNLDFVYIDGNHFYPYIKKDIELWWPKIKDGGVIGGHDYNIVEDESEIDKHIHDWKINGISYGVVKAVNEFSKNNKLSLKYEKIDIHSCYDWWIDKEQDATK